MTYREAQELLDSIELQRASGAAVIRRIANGEHIVIIQKSQYYCWTRQDWLTYVQNEALSLKKPRKDALREEGSMAQNGR